MELDIATIITLIISALGIFAGGAYLKAKGKLGQIKDLGKEAIDVLIAAVDAVEDDKITKEETEKIKKEAKEAAVAFNILIGKTK